jgi:hypothetical protein
VGDAVELVVGYEEGCEIPCGCPSEQSAFLHGADEEWRGERLAEVVGGGRGKG